MSIIKMNKEGDEIEKEREGNKKLLINSTGKNINKKFMMRLRLKFNAS